MAKQRSAPDEDLYLVIVNIEFGGQVQVVVGKEEACRKARERQGVTVSLKIQDDFRYREPNTDV